VEQRPRGRTEGGGGGPVHHPVCLCALFSPSFFCPSGFPELCLRAEVAVGNRSARESRRLEKSSEITESNRQPVTARIAAQPCPQAPHLHAAWTPPGTTFLIPGVLVCVFVSCCLPAAQGTALRQARGFQAVDGPVPFQKQKNQPLTEVSVLGLFAAGISWAAEITLRKAFRCSL